MKVRKTVLTMALSAAMVGGPATAALAAEGLDTAPDETASTAVPVAETAGAAPAAAEEATPSDVAPEPPTEPAAETTTESASPSPESPVTQEPEAEGEEAAEPAAPESADADAGSADAEQPRGDDSPVDPVAKEGAVPASTDDVAGLAAETHELEAADDEQHPAAEPGADLDAAYGEPGHFQHWHDDGCHYWYWTPDVDGSGRDWQGWYGQPQIHFLYFNLADGERYEEGTSTYAAYSRSIENEWSHAWSGGLTQVTDVVGSQDANALVQQAALIGGYKGTGLAEAQELFARYGIDTLVLTDEEIEDYIDSWGYRYYIDNGIYSREQVVEWIYQNLEGDPARAAYQATQLAVWYLADGEGLQPGGNDIVSQFFDVSEDNKVTVSQWAKDNLQDASPRTLALAAGILEYALNAIPPHTPTAQFTPGAAVLNADGSRTVGFDVSVAGGEAYGEIPVALSLPGKPLPAGVVLTDAAGNEVTTVTAGDKVFIQVPKGVKAADLEGLILTATTSYAPGLGSPRYYTGFTPDHNHQLESYDQFDEYGQPLIQRWLITLGDPGEGGENVTFILVPLPADLDDPIIPTEPEDPVDPVDPADPIDPVEPVDPVDPVDPTDPVEPVDPVDPVDPTDAFAKAPSTRADTGAKQTSATTTVAADAPTTTATASDAEDMAGPVAHTGGAVDGVELELLAAAAALAAAAGLAGRHLMKTRRQGA